jgi:3-oxoadipate CoA-transferase alpha subunit
MINKIARSVADAMAGIQDGATVLIGGFGTAGIPGELIDGLIEQGARDLTVVNNNAGNGDTGLAALLKAGRVRKDHLQLSAPGRQPCVRRPLPCRHA